MRAVLSPPGNGGERKLTLRVVPVFKDDELLSFVLEWQEDCTDIADTTGASKWPQMENYELLIRGRDTMALVLNRDGLVTWSSTSTAAKLGCESEEVLGQHWAALAGLRENEVSARNWISRRDDPKRGFWAEVQEVSMTRTGSDSSGLHERLLVIRDLTEELVVERKLQETRRETASLLSGGDGVPTVDSTLVKSTVDAAGIVRKVVKEEESKSKDGPRTINTEFGRDIPPRLVGDPVAFASITRALISNAVEYSTKDEYVSVRLYTIFQDKGSIALGLTVTDRGIGIDEDVERTIFSSRVPSPRHAASGEATRGLSLHLADEAARKMGGCLGFSPNHDGGKGTVFRAQVKLARWPTDPAWVPPPSSYAGGRAPLPLIRWMTPDTREHIEAIAPRTRILFVDDNSIQRKVFQKLVAKIGFTELDLAASGQEAVDMFLANPLGYDVVFMDRHMPGMGGAEATEKIRSAGFLNVPIIDMNTLVWGDPKQNQEEGKRTWIAKPFSLEALARTIMDWVPKERTTWPVVVNSRL